jgi:hypothetical protein
MLPAPTSKVRTIAKARSARPKSVRPLRSNLNNYWEFIYD